MKIEWDSMRLIGYAYTKSGKKAVIQQAYSTRCCGKYYSVYIEGEKRNSATRATLEKVNQILENN